MHVKRHTKESCQHELGEVNLAGKPRPWHKDLEETELWAVAHFDVIGDPIKALLWPSDGSEALKGILLN